MADLADPIESESMNGATAAAACVSGALRSGGWSGASTGRPDQRRDVEFQRRDRMAHEPLKTTFAALAPTPNR